MAGFDDELKKLLCSISTDPIETPNESDVMMFTYEGLHYYTQSTIYDGITKKIHSIISKKIDVSYKYFTEKLNLLICQNIGSLTTQMIWDYFSKLKPNNYIIYRPLFGVTMIGIHEVSLGSFHFMNKNAFIELLIDKCDPDIVNPIVTEQVIKAVQSDTCEVFLGVTVVAFDEDMGQFVAEKKHRQLENVLRFMYGNSSKLYGLGIFTQRNKGIFKSYIFDDISLSSHNSVRDQGAPVFTFPIEPDGIIFSPSFSSVWELLDVGKSSAMQERILRAIDWIGRSINEVEPSIAYVQLFFAIECLLSDQEMFVSPSITVQIGDYMAFIIGSTKEERIKVSARMTELYRIRSKIAHGRKADNIDDYYFDALDYARSAVLGLLTDNRFSEIRNIKDLRAIMTDLRFN